MEYPAALARKCVLLDDGTLLHVSGIQQDPIFRQFIHQLTQNGWNIRPQQVPSDRIEQHKAVSVEGLSPLITDVIRWVNQVNASKGSDIHITDFNTACEIEARIGNEILPLARQKPGTGDNIIRALWALVPHGLFNPSLPQSASLARAQLPNLPIGVESLRITNLPLEYGISAAVIRINQAVETWPDLEALGFADDHREEIEALLAKETGILLVAGPPNEGKNTFVLGLLGKLEEMDSASGRRRSRIGLGAPVERRMPGVKQIRLDSESPPAERMAANARILASVQRFDYDLLAFDEISGTADLQLLLTSVQTGRRVFATLHAPESEAVPRKLLAYEPPAYLQPLILDPGAFSGIVSVRLVSRLCPSCADSDLARSPLLSHRHLAALISDDPSLRAISGHFRRRGQGCGHCLSAGGAPHRGGGGEAKGNRLAVPGIVGRIPVLEIVFPDREWMKHVEANNLAAAHDHAFSPVAGAALPGEDPDRECNKARPPRLDLRRHSILRALRGEIDPAWLDSQPGGPIGKGDLAYLRHLARQIQEPETQGPGGAATASSALASSTSCSAGGDKDRSSEQVPALNRPGKDGL